ncbi:MAG: hypothetical protein AAFY03_06595, partial [Pseudomonadota bacterium]
WRDLLADPTGGQPRFECGAGSLAGEIIAVCGASLRSAGPGGSALAGGLVPVAPDQDGRVGGGL